MCVEGDMHKPNGFNLAALTFDNCDCLHFKTRSPVKIKKSLSGIPLSPTLKRVAYTSPKHTYDTAQNIVSVSILQIYF